MATAWTSLTACAEGVPSAGAAAPTAGEMNAQAQAPEGPLPPTTAQPAGPLPPTGAVEMNAEAQAASAEPANPSEYDVAADTDPAALNDFRGTLDPYGEWADDAAYGTVWIPASTVVGVGFTPYVTHGHWGLTAENRCGRSGSAERS